MRIRFLMVLVVASCLSHNVKADTEFPRICLEELESFSESDKLSITQSDDWAAYDYDFSKWPIVRLDYLEKTGTICWYKSFVHINSKKEHTKRQGLLLSHVGAYEVYWDGVLIGGSGKIGTSKSEEVPGPLRTYYQIPDRLYNDGNHVVGIKSSNFNRLPFSKDYNYIMDLIDQPDANADLSAPYIGSLLSLGVCLLVAFFYLIYYLVVDRNRAYLLLSILSFTVSAFAAVFITSFIDMPYYFSKISTTSSVTLAAISCWLLPVFLTELYQSRNKKYWILAATAIVLINLILPIN